MRFLELFSHPKVILGMIHAGPLPGTPHNTASVDAIAAQAACEARTYADAGVDGLLVENMHDVPYLAGTVGPEIVAGMTAVGLAVRQTAALPLGVQILAAANREALAVGHACGACFIRAENFAYAHVADEGLLPTAEAGPLLRYRRQIGAEAVAVLADVKKKHSSHAITADVPLAEAARTTAFFGADGIVVTGVATAEPTAVEDVRTVRRIVDVPVCVGSGLNPENLSELWPHADVFIVGSYVKEDGRWSNPVDPARLRTFMARVAALRGGE